MATFGNGRRVAIVAGVRTPFAKAGTAFKSISAIDLGKLCVAELLQRTNLDGKEVQALVFGTVIPSVVAPNIAREVSLLPLLPKGVQAYSVSRACASANQAITDAADQIALGHVDVAIASGSESLSNIPILHAQGFADALVLASKAKSFPARLKALARIRPKDLVPVTPAIAEPSTGETMGQSAEKMAKLNAIAREEQDHFALRSHRLAAAGTADGRLTAEIMPVYVPPRFESVLTSDNGIREDTSYEQLAALDPGEQLLQAPVLAAPVALKRAGLSLKDMDLVEMHEAFAAQVLSNLKGFESKWWAERAGFSQPVGEVDRAKLNVMGGSIAIGHPFGATGARITTTLLNELRRRGGQFGLMTVCSAGGMGFAMVVERTR